MFARTFGKYPIQSVYRLIPNEALIEECNYKVDNVYIEKRFDDIIPDIVLEINNQLIFVEIAVTHFVSNEKLKKIQNQEHPVIEIDISTLKDNFELSQLEYIIIDQLDKKKWLHNPRAEEKLQQVFLKFIEKHNIDIGNWDKAQQQLPSPYLRLKNRW